MVMGTGSSKAMAESMEVASTGASFTPPVAPGLPSVVIDDDGTTSSTRDLYQNTLTCLALSNGPPHNLGLSYATFATSFDGNSINALPPPFK